MSCMFDLGGGKAVIVQGVGAQAAKVIAQYMQTNSIATDTAKTAALNTPAVLTALMKLFFDDAIQIVDAQTMTRVP
jgi:hypothetical protein